MRCSKAYKLISPYMDGELPVKEREVFEFHVKKCAVCSVKLNEMQQIHGLFAQSGKFKAPYGFSARVMTNLEADTAKDFSLIPVFLKLTKALVVLIIISVGIIAGSFLSNSIGLQKSVNNVSFLSLDVFDAAPPDSLGGVYLAMTEVGYEK